MNRKNALISRQVLSLAAVTVFCVTCLAQGTNVGVADDHFNSLLLSFDYASNTNVFGNINNHIRQPSFSPAVTFSSKQGFDLMLSGNIAGNSDDSLKEYASELDIMGGYNFKVTKNLTIYPSLAWFHYSSNSHPLRSMFNSDIRLDMDYNKKFFNAGISAGYLVGKYHTFYGAIRNYYQIDIRRFLFRNASLSLQPGIDANLGDYEYLNLFYLDHLRQYPAFYLIMMKSPALEHYVRRQQIKHPELTTEEIIDDLLEEKAEDSMGFTSFSVYLPVFFIMGNFSLNAGVYACIPVSQPDYLPDNVVFYVDIGISYLIDLSSK